MERAQRIQTAMDLLNMVDKDLEKPFIVGDHEKAFDHTRAYLGGILQDLKNGRYQ